MKKIFLLPFLFFWTGNAQEIINLGESNTAITAWNFKTHTNYVATTDDTTGYISLGQFDPLWASEVGLIAVATDSINATVNVIGRNGALTSVTDTYTFELELISNTGGSLVTMLKDPTVNRLEGMTQFRVGTVYDSDSLGTTSGRTLKWYLFWKK